MGDQPSKPQTQSSFEEKINHPSFQHSEVVKVNQTGDQLIKMRVAVSGEKTIRDWENGLNSIKQFNRQSLFLPAYHSFESQGFCGTSGILNVFFPYYPYLLSEQIQNRQETEEKKSFSETELWYLLYTICSQAAQFHKEGQGSKLGDIRPLNIFINDGGYIKVANIWSWPNAENNYEASLLNNTTTYLSPQQLQELHYGKNYPETNSQKSESFSIGLTLLDCILLSDSSKLYDFKKYYFFEEKLRKALDDLQKEPLSEYFKKLVTQLCEIDPKKRSTAIQICKELQPHEKQIMKLSDFQKPGGYSYGSYRPSSYTTPEASSYMYSSEVTKGFNEKLISNQNYQENPPTTSPPSYSYAQNVGMQKQPRFPIQSHPKSNNQQEYQPQVGNTYNNVYLAGKYESPPKSTQQANYVHPSSYSPSYNYKINESYQPREVTKNVTSTQQGATKNYLNTYNSSYTPIEPLNRVPQKTTQTTAAINPNSYKIADINTSQQESQNPTNNAFKQTTSTFVVNKDNNIKSNAAPLVLPSGGEPITYEISPGQANNLKIEELNRDKGLNQLLQGVKSQPKQFPTLKQIEEKAVVNKRESR